MIRDTPLTVIDVGARGEPGAQFGALREHVLLVAFEPDLTEYERLAVSLPKRGWSDARVLPVALAAESGECDFFVTRTRALSSLLRPNEEKMGHGWAVEEIRKVNARTLDELAAGGDLWETADVLKVDAQGADLQVLIGGQNRVLPKALAVIVEASFREHYLGQAQIGEVECFLRERGFKLFATDIHPAPALDERSLSRRRVDWSDSLFLRDSDWVDQLPQELQTGARRKLVSIMALFGLLDECSNLVEGFEQPEKSILSSLERRARKVSWRWRVRLVAQALRCAIRPSRKQRERVCRQAATVAVSKRHWWRLSESRF
jgi:FkbM family methyltransferase